jgi:hypothetical protein
MPRWLRHASISIKSSTNGTFVRRPDTAHVRTELLLDGKGEISLGRAFDQVPIQVIRFKRDRRALYRVCTHRVVIWTPPPTLRQGEQDREKHLAIGESDRMALKLIKP